MLTLSNGVGRDKRYLCLLSSYCLQGFLIPSRHIIYITDAFCPLVEKPYQIFFLFFGLFLLANKGRVAHDVIKVYLITNIRFGAATYVGRNKIDVAIFYCRLTSHQGFFLEDDVCVLGTNCGNVGRHLNDVPIHPQSIPLADVRVALQGQEVDIVMDNLLCLCKHLCLAYPKGCCGDGYGEVVYLDAVELVDADLDRRQSLPCELRLPVRAMTNDFVLKPSQREVCFREEVAGAAGRVEERKGGQFVLIGIELLLPLLLISLFEYCFKFTPQVIEKEWVDNFVYVLDTCVVHTAGASCLGVQSALEEASENGGRYLAPVEVEARILQKNLLQLFRELRYLYLFLKQAAVCVLEGF